MIHLKSVSRKSTPTADAYPFNIPVLQHLGQITFHQPVTFFVGENGSGKSTLLEAIAAGAESITIGGDDVQRDETLQHARKLAATLRLAWRKRSRRGFFLRAEDFFNFARRINSLSRDLEDLANEYQKEYDQNPAEESILRAKGSVLGQKRALAERYGEDLDGYSHGEIFLKLFQTRFVPGELYLLDEPEAPLSPLRQLAFLSMLHDMVNQDCQFIIATHSPIIMAFRQAAILSFDQHPVGEVAYDDLEHVSLTRAFLNDPGAFLRTLQS